MFEIKVTVEAPELATAVKTLAEALSQNPIARVATPLGDVAKGSTSPEPAPAANVAPLSNATSVPVAPVVNPTPAAAVAPIAPAPVVGAPLPTAAPIAPVATAPQITIEQIGKAGADLISQNPGAMPQLMALLQKYGVQSAQQLKPDQIGAFATEMRALGAKV